MNSKVLVVDDSATVRKQVNMALTEAGLTVAEAVNGFDGHDQICSGGINCVICDVNMPKMDGIEMVERVRSGGKHARLPIIMLTTEGSNDMIARARAAGANGWIVKPFKADMLVAAVRKLTGQ